MWGRSNTTCLPRTAISTLIQADTQTFIYSNHSTLPACLLCASTLLEARVTKINEVCTVYTKVTHKRTHARTHSSFHNQVGEMWRGGPRALGTCCISCRGTQPLRPLGEPMQTFPGGQYLLHCATPEWQVCFYVTDNINTESVLLSVVFWPKIFDPSR